MDNLILLEKFANPELIHSLSLGDKLVASLNVMILGMGVTFIALVILWGLIVLMCKMLKSQEKEIKIQQEVSVEDSIIKDPTIDGVENEEELVAVITGAIAATLRTSTHNIVVKNIKRITDPTPTWARAGRMEQMNSKIFH
ncbi:OadG family protein [Anaerophilus nitritogenes]|uniref:OadG family protein n=1 Tax=Anaerophilus nitritogenes TaxID=2498136 RepID=UPI00101CD130|nr:OadG family protein [Anaerophilus nitritogenes]